MDNTGQFLICEVCGCPVASDSLQLHSDWHDDLLTASALKKELANPHRTQFQTFVQDC